jgi:ABC-type Co2+ transport system permease subunit
MSFLSGPFSLLVPLWAIHMQDGQLTEAWWIGGFLAAGLLALAGAWGIRDEEIPRVAVLTAAFFVGTLIHVPILGGPPAHLLLNGLLGVILRRRALLAIPVGLFLQAVLFGHGGFTVLGANSCVMGLPALLAWGLFDGLRRLPWVVRPWFRAGLVMVATLTFILSLVYSLTLLCVNPLGSLGMADFAWANRVTLHPLTLLAALLLAAAAAWGERRLENAPEFPLGLLVGQTTVLATIGLYGLTLILGGQADWHTVVLVAVVTNLPLAAVEGIIVGFTVGFLARVKPEMLGWTRPAPEQTEELECVADPVR